MANLCHWTTRATIRTRLALPEVMSRIRGLSREPSHKTGAGAGIRESVIEAGAFRMDYRGSRVLDVGIRGTVEERAGRSLVHLTFAADSWWLLGAGLAAGFGLVEFWRGTLTLWQAIITAVACSALFGALDMWMAPAVITRRVSSWLAGVLDGEVASTKDRAGEQADAADGAR